MLRLQALGFNTPSGVPYTDEEINALARKGKQRGHLPGVGRVLPGRATDVLIPPPPPPPQCTHNSGDVKKLKKKNKYLTKQVNLMMKLFRSDDKFSQMLNQYESTPEFGSGSGGCGDDEMADDEDGGEDGEDEEDGDIQKKLLNLKRGVIFDLGVALWMFTRCIIILKRVKDLQLGVESYQNKLNITKPETYRSDISKRTPNTAYNNPQGIIYVDKYKRNKLMRWDELYKFSNGTLTSVRSVLHDISSNLRMDYLPKRRWSNLDRQMSRIMIKAIDKLMLERRLMRSLEKFVGGIEYGEDFR
ncbi:hypothetical protein Tco_1220543 [Tanacetum coccineum]